MYRANSDRDAWFSGETGQALTMACHRVDLNKDMVLKLIEHYADRKKAFHKDFNELIRKGDWMALKRAILCGS